jgi:hypothetical protein
MVSRSTPINNKIKNKILMEKRSQNFKLQIEQQWKTNKETLILPDILFSRLISLIWSTLKFFRSELRKAKWSFSFAVIFPGSKFEFSSLSMSGKPSELECLTLKVGSNSRTAVSEGE